MAQSQAYEQDPVLMSEAEYLEFEEQSDTKHEYVGGRVYAMAGAEWEHVMITQSVSAMLYARLRGSGCRVSTSDLRLKVVSSRVSYRYPDVMVVCGEPDFAENRKTIQNPTLIVEVLSPSTALEDRNAKLDEYTRIESVQAYVLVSQDEARVEVFSRHQSGKWLYVAYRGLDAVVELPSIDCTLLLSEVYEQVTLADMNNTPEQED